MSHRIRSLSTLYKPLLQGTARPPRRRRWILLLVVAALAYLVGRAAGSSGHRCADDWDCPSLACRAGRCA